ncbi:DNA polymerase IV 1 [Candidatus Phycosocius spiralis]|uniref:DNA polymerase IV n=2 Tax=Candidatus Phycosocius spiralis TaxID=2815099 RepID=A0ABQ4PY22_9PROT|nr:DNA polymerase IV 1 [Candidatus Phycosocius spiralis]
MRCGSCGSRRLIYHDQLNDLAIAHIDCDAFFAAIHKRDQPELRDKPVIVGGGKRGVVATCCYIARASGVRSAMAMFKALKLCPQAHVVSPNMALYSREGRAIRHAMQALTPLVEAVSIDEAYLDLTGTQRVHNGPPVETLARFQHKIEVDMGLTVSIGLSHNKFLAKTASELDKPRGFAIMTQSDVKAILWPKPVSFLHGVGPSLAKRLERDGYRQVGDLAGAPPGQLASRYGEHGDRLALIAHGIDHRRVETDSERKSISSETTFHHDLKLHSDLEPILIRLCAKIGQLSRAKGLAGQVVTLKLKTSSFKSISRRVTLKDPTATGRVILDALKPMLTQEIPKGPFRLMGVALSGFALSDLADRGDLLSKHAPKHAALERAMDGILARYGKGVIKTGG